MAIWTPAFVGVNALVGREAVERFGGRLPGGLLGAVLTLALVIFTVRSLVVPLFTWRGRRLWLGRLLRIRHWGVLADVGVLPAARGVRPRAGLSGRIDATGGGPGPAAKDATE